MQKKQVRRKRAEAFSQDLDFFPPTTSVGQGLPTGFDWSTRSPDQRGFPDLWNRVSQASPLPGSGGPLPSHLVFVPPGPSIGQAPIEARFPGDAPRQARASLAYSTASPGARARARRSRITPPCQARGPPRSRALPRRACCCASWRTTAETCCGAAPCKA